MTWDCAHCPDHDCYQGRDCSTFADEIKRVYEKDETARKIHEASTAIEGNYYMQKNRLEELMQFAHDMGWKRLGIAFCVGFAAEAETLADILAADGFEVSSVCCKACAIMKDDLGLTKIRDERDEAICNPVGQAKALAEDEVEFAVVMGLCVGHDTLFYKYAKMPVTTFIVKDRVLGHNPVASIYSRYWKNKIARDQEERKAGKS